MRKEILFCLSLVLVLCTTGCDFLAGKVVPPAKIGEVIPDWVYENSEPQDAYYSVLNSTSNIILYTSQNCPVGRKIKSVIQNSIEKADVKDKFVMKPMLPPRSMLCHKFAENISQSRMDSVMMARQKGASQYMGIYYGNGKSCVPYAKTFPVAGDTTY